jgi:sugar/nucleoside kinase (ribokinase family)
MAENPNGRPPKGLFVGLATVDLTYPVEAIPGRNAKISVGSQYIAAGGPATNAAATFAFLGGRSALVTAVGVHPLGKMIRHDLDDHSVALHDVAPRRAEPPPVSSIMVLRATGERTVVSANAAAFSSLEAEFNPRWLQGVSVVQVDGHYMPLCISGARMARLRGIPVVLESGSWKEGMAELLPFTDIAICSDDYRPPDCRDNHDVMEFLAAQGIRRLAITRGASPVLWVDNRERGKIAVKKIHPIDTLGAGDIFHGAFCYYACQGLGFRQALAAAARGYLFVPLPGHSLVDEGVSTQLIPGQQKPGRQQIPGSAANSSSHLRLRKPECVDSA